MEDCYHVLLKFKSHSMHICSSSCVSIRRVERAEPLPPLPVASLPSAHPNLPSETPPPPPPPPPTSHPDATPKPRSPSRSQPPSPSHPPAAQSASLPAASLGGLQTGTEAEEKGEGKEGGEEEGGGGGEQADEEAVGEEAAGAVGTDEGSSDAETGRTRGDAERTNEEDGIERHTGSDEPPGACALLRCAALCYVSVQCAVTMCCVQACFTASFLRVLCIFGDVAASHSCCFTHCPLPLPVTLSPRSTPPLTPVFLSASCACLSATSHFRRGEAPRRG